ncbi:hypothetical protein SBA1_970008 [Candidatus Sulfotelmatobacter kueseliae]|uniref:Uncharacterized protein n=1 Tax=Candidatus Sulfotelmatobacter kueseliae TaxID=2042962 RepID=A0A2U3LDH1_9BACT|nr:hypothetical protein SBA1_970008 [Candidatus Sulfotelmatobacter kueseliae]
MLGEGSLTPAAFAIISSKSSLLRGFSHTGRVKSTEPPGYGVTGVGLWVAGLGSSVFGANLHCS